MISDVMLGQWLPDLPDLKNPGLTICDNCYPTSGSYAPFRGPVGTGLSVAGSVRGAVRLQRADGSVVQVVGTDSDLNVIVGGSVTASSLALSLGPEAYWSFEQFNSQVWAFAYGVQPHYLPDIASDTTFVPHPGTAPKASSVARVGDFLVTANMEDIDASAAPYRIRWSPFNNPAADYETDIGTQSGAVDMDPALGIVQGIFGGRSDVVLQQYGVSRLSFTGGATVFSKDVIEEGRGCVSKPSVVTVGSTVYFLSSDGFCRTDGASVEVISTSRVFDWFLENASSVDLFRVQGAVNWPARCVVWSFVPQNGTGYARQIIFSWAENKWSTASLPVDWFFATTQAGTTLEQYSALYSNIDTATIPLDSPEFKAGDRILQAIIDGELSTMTGETLPATWETGEFQLKPGYRTMTRGVAPLIENIDANTSIAIGVRKASKGGAIHWSPDTVEGSSGYAPIIKDGRYMRGRMTTPAGASWSKASGMQVDATVTGRT